MVDSLKTPEFVMPNPAAAIATILAIFVAVLALAYIIVPPFVGFLWLFGLIS